MTFISIWKIGNLNFTGYFIREERVSETDFGSVWSKRKNSSSGVMCSFSWEIRLILKDDQGKGLFFFSQAQMMFVAVELTSEVMQYTHLLKEIQGMGSHLIHVEKWGRRLDVVRTVSGVKKDCRNGVMAPLVLLRVCADQTNWYLWRKNWLHSHRVFISNNYVIRLFLPIRLQHKIA